MKKAALEHITHYFLEHVPEQFKSTLMWLHGLLLGESTCLDWILFSQIGIEDAICSKVQKLESLKLLSIQEHIYRVLVLEFISTLTIQDMRGAADLEDDIQFQLGGEYRHMSIREFTRGMDIYPASFIDSPNDFATLTRESDFLCFKAFYES
ncbi:unnamed protein product [Linum trigynum]|uniref:Uncharacterized protein n=1 Tax=Linum trigynum TaxID=586398 RepID=A0AAV2ECW1_9ROSI